MYLIAEIYIYIYMIAGNLVVYVLYWVQLFKYIRSRYRVLARGRLRRLLSRTLLHTGALHIHTHTCTYICMYITAMMHIYIYRASI